ncbi:mannose-6-phosphate isomerase, class I [Microbacterium pseudoresistens]|uniref:mannose-6-phosphate isomerase n=1 Tax=Microbacterium pseudoresistens TaxID=640634 RepID=A0A7Y9JNW1_9MICO|nr:mannose-6-phosphate isomerase, class I [Microbacterium pseudoresistens]NYD54968.1 mannose-6-phosphate isomerase [Microbacterium pseudoresistens]
MLYALTNTPRDYAWGSTTLLAALEGRDRSAGPEAEVWFGDHPGDPADLADGRTLDAVTGGTLPYLLKLLAAETPLSIQVHPTRAEAEAGWAQESALAVDDPARNYRDANHKPELIVALSDRFEALCGLRPLQGTRALLDLIRPTPGVVRLREALDGGVDDAASLRAALRWALAEASAAEIADVIDAVAAAADAHDDLAFVAGIAAHYPGDAGVVVALLMNHVVLSRGEAVFLRAGLLHAYVAGLGVEIMAASDNVLRGGLTPKRIDVPELLAIVDTVPGVVPVLGAEDAEAAVREYPVPVPDFALRRVRVGAEPRALEVRAPSMVLATAGTVRVTGSGSTLDAPVGTVVFADADEPTLTLTGDGEAFVAEPGRG